MGDQEKPWGIGKSFDSSAPIGPLRRVGRTKQIANLDQMILSVAEQISNLPGAFELQPGAIIHSGTPENVGPVVRGDVIDCHIDGLPNLSVKIA